MARNPVLLFFVATLFLASVVLAEEAAVGVDELVEAHRIVVIGDIHGDPDNFKTLLKWAALVKEDENGIVSWAPRYSSGPKNSSKVRTTLVQLGDLTDRGENDMECLHIAMTLQEQAESSGVGEVVLLLGNHELMNLQGQYHYVHRAQFGGFRSKSLRDAAFRGAFGQYIVDHFKLVHVDEGIVFVHAGFADSSSLLPPEELNEKARVALQNKDYNNNALFGVKSPVWTRKMIQDAMYEQCGVVSAILKFYNATSIVVGHTPQRSGHVETFCDGQVVAADVGISRWMMNNVEAFEITVLTYRNNLTGELTKQRAMSPLNEQIGAMDIKGFAPSDTIMVNDRDDDDL